MEKKSYLTDEWSFNNENKKFATWTNDNMEGTFTYYGKCKSVNIMIAVDIQKPKIIIKFKE